MMIKRYTLALTAALALATTVHATERIEKPVPSVDTTWSSASSGTTGTVTGTVSPTIAPTLAPAGGNAAFNSSDTSRAYGLVLPQPSRVPDVGQATAPCVVAASKGVSVGWSFVSSGEGGQSMDPVCMAERQAVALEAVCSYRTAALIRHWIAVQGSPALADVLAKAGARPWESQRDLPAGECRR